MEFKDYYKTLGVEKTATAEEIKKAFRKLARKFHPDVSKVPDASARMAEVNEANGVLSDPEKRAEYDQLLAQPQSAREFRSPPDWQQGFDFTSVGGNAQHSDFFEELFGRATARAGAGRVTLKDRFRVRLDTHASSSNYWIPILARCACWS
jgi:DnaJ-class molecular chaperone with C-terminal Zn finger domain